MLEPTPDMLVAEHTPSPVAQLWPRPVSLEGGGGWTGESRAFVPHRFVSVSLLCPLTSPRRAPSSLPDFRTALRPLPAESYVNKAIRVVLD